MPALTEFYGLTPADVDQMTYRELNEYLEQLADFQRRQEADNGAR